MKEMWVREYILTLLDEHRLRVRKITYISLIGKT
jgi:hypothetical protein